MLEDIPLSHWEQLVGLFDVRARSIAGFRHRPSGLTRMRACCPPQESTPPRVDAPSTPYLEQLSLADECGAWPGLKVAPDEVTPLLSDFAAGQLDPDNLFDPEIGALRLMIYPAATKAACAARLTQAWCCAVTESWINVSTNPPALPDIEKFEVRWNDVLKEALACGVPDRSRLVRSAAASA